jgi:glycosyltransferase involved in cell wall biosynthesis
LVAPIWACARNTGGGQRTFHLYKALTEFCSVDVLLVSQPEFGNLEALYPNLHRELFPAAQDIHLHRSANAAHPKAAAARRLLRRATKALRPPQQTYAPSPTALRHLDELLARTRYDAIVGRYLLETSQSGVLTQATVPVLLDVDDRDDKVLETRLRAGTTPPWHKPWLAWRLAQTRPVIERLVQRCAHLWLASEADGLEVEHPSRSVLPNVPYLPEGTGRMVTPMPGTKTCIFVGTCIHRVNREGVRHFVERCWPAIRRAEPQACFRVVGSGGWDALRDELERHPGVSVVGSVPSVADEYRAAAFAVVPLFEGSGTKIKVLESLLFGRTLVAHDHAVRGLEDLRHGESLMVARSDEAFATQVLSLYADPAAAAAMAAHGRNIVEREYSYARVARVVRDDCTRVLARTVESDRG